MYKKGLSDILASVMIILLAIASVVIVWVFVSNFFGSSGEELSRREAEQYVSLRGSFELRNAIVDSSTNRDFEFLFYNSGSVEVVNLIVAVIKDDGRIEINANEQLEPDVVVYPLETKRFSFSVNEDLEEGWIVEVIPVFLVEDDEVTNADLAKTIILEGGVVQPPPTQEICDNGIDDGDADGDIDCADAECVDYPSCLSELSLGLLNNGNAIDAGDGIRFISPSENYFSSLVDPSGNLVYFYKSLIDESHSQIYDGHNSLGRFNSQNKNWEIHSLAGWSSLQGSASLPLNYGLMVFDSLHPFYGFGNSLNFIALEYIVSGEDRVDVHGDGGLFRLEGNSWTMWNNPLFSLSRIKTIFYDYSDSQFSFDFNEQRTEGLLVSIYNEVGYAPPNNRDKLVAAKYIDGAVPSWLRWKDSNWVIYSGGTNSDCDLLGRCSSFFPDSAWQTRLYHPNLVNIKGTDNYLVTFAKGNDGFTSALLYDDSDLSWKWWNGDSFSLGGFYQFDEFISMGYGFDYKFYSMESLDDGRVVIFWGDPLRFTVFNYVDSSLITQTIATVTGAVAEIDAAGNLWAAYSDAVGIKILKFNETEFSNVTDFAVTNVKVVGINFVDGNIPVVFYERAGRLYAISDLQKSYWQGENFMFRDRAVQNILNPGIATLENSWLETGGSEYGPQTGKNLGLDSAGYLYSPSVSINKVEIYNSSTGATVSRWQGWGDSNNGFHFPSGVDVFNAKGKIYVSDYITGSGSAVIGNGRVRIWDLSARDFGFQTPISYPISLQRPTNTVLFPSDVAIDELNSYLYVSETMDDKVYRYDLDANGLSFGAPTVLSSSLEGSLDMPKGIDVDSDGNLYVVDSLKHRIRKYNSAGSNVLNFGSSGKSNGQFILPESITVNSNYIFVTDVYSKKILIFNKTNGNFVHEFGQFNGQKFILLGGIVADDNYLYVSSDKKIYKFALN